MTTNPETLPAVTPDHADLVARLREAAEGLQYGARDTVRQAADALEATARPAPLAQPGREEVAERICPFTASPAYECAAECTCEHEGFNRSHRLSAEPLLARQDARPVVEMNPDWSPPVRASDCAVHNEPAQPNGPRDCGVEVAQENLSLALANDPRSATPLEASVAYMALRTMFSHRGDGIPTQFVHGAEVAEHAGTLWKALITTLRNPCVSVQPDTDTPPRWQTEGDMSATLPTDPDSVREEDWPAMFEAWWETSPRRHRLPIGYSDKKCLAYDAFEAGGRQTQREDRLREENARLRAALRSIERRTMPHPDDTPADDKRDKGIAHMLARDALSTEEPKP